MKKDYPTAAERLKELTDQLEAGVREVFTSDRYADCDAPLPIRA